MTEPTCSITARDLEALDEKVRIMFDALRTEQNQYKDMARMALEKAEATASYRLETMNNFRAQILEERAGYLRRESYDAAQRAVEDKIGLLMEFQANLNGRFWAGGLIITLVSIGVSVAGLLLH